MEYFTHLPKFQVIICKECQYAVLPSYIHAHFTAKPQHGLEKEERQRIINAVVEIDGLISSNEALRQCEFLFPPPTSKPIVALAEPRKNGMQCTFEAEDKPCSYICCSIQQMREHCLKEHGWKSKDKGGRSKKRSNQVPWQTNIHCQRFFKSGPKSSYFEVSAEAEASPSSPGIASRHDQFKAAKRELEAALRKAEEKERQYIEEMEESREPNPWLRRVGWAAHLAGLDRAEIRTWVEMPDGEEPKLEILCKAFDWMIQDAQYTTVQEVVGQAALFEANRKEVNNEPQKPFDSWMDIDTVQRYTHVWKQLLCYVFRAEGQEAEKRPAYKLTGSQQIAIHEVKAIIQEFQEWKDGQEAEDGDKGRESDEEIEFMDRIQQEILALCIALLNHPLKDNEYRSIVISGLAVLGIRDDDGWLDAEDYTPKYSAVIKLARLMVVQKGYEQREEARKRLEERGLTGDEANEQATSYYYFIRRLTHQFMTMAHDGKDPTPMQWIFKSRSYGFKIRYTTTAAGCIQWIGDNVLYQQIRFGMTQVRSMVYGLVEEARKELFKLMEVDKVGAGGEQATEGQPPGIGPPPIDWESMVDNPTESRVGWSFLDDERTKWAVDGQWWLYERIFKEQRLREQFIEEGGSRGGRTQFRKAAAEAYQQHIDRFKELLLMLMHICGGAPGRAPEILGIRWKNTEQGGIRNIFIEDGLVAFVTGYHKGYRSSNNIKIIHRYLPREIGELLVYYLWLVLPFHEKLQFQAIGERCNSPFLWGDGKKVDHRQWTGPRRGRGKGRGRSSSSGQAESSPTEDRVRVGQGGSQAESSPTEDRVRVGPGGSQAESSPDGQRESSPASDDIKQYRPEWTSERLRKIMQKASMRWIGVKLNISSWRHIAIAISRRYCQDPFQSEGQGDVLGNASDEENIDDDPWDLQAGHGTHTAGMVYARELMEGNHVVVGRREKFRHVSQEWHQFWQFGSAGTNAGQEATNAGQKRKRVTVEGNMQHAQIARWKRLQTVDIRDELKQMLGDEAEFRGLQKPALEAIMSGKSPIVVVMGTGAGKSLLFQLPAHSQKSGTTIVIVPLKSLERSLHERCHKAGISCIQWDPQQRDRMAQIVLVQPEAVVGKMFAQYLNKLQGLGQLDRVVVDECHTVLDSTPDFRPNMRKAGALMMDRGVQMVYLTATLSPNDEAEFLDIMKVEIPDDCKFRGCTSRPNIAYSVVEHSDEQTEAVCQLVAEKLEQYPSPAKIIVYSSSIETIEELGGALNCHMYYADVGNAKEKDEIQKEWGRGNGRVVVASNAFGLGIDQPDVRVVIHVGPIYQMQGYGQESGRGGRDGKRSEAIILVGAGRQEALQKQMQSRRQRRGTINKKQLEQERVDRFISGERCRRIHLDQEMDGRVDRVRCEDGEERCDVCQKDDEAEAEVEALRQAYTEEREEQEEYEHDQMLDSGINMPSSLEMQGIPNIDNEANDNTPIELPESPSNSVGSNVSMAEFQAQQASREQQRRHIQQQNQQEGQEVWEFEQQLEEWKGQCALCFVHGIKDHTHSIQECQQDGANDVREALQLMVDDMTDQKKKRFENYSCCFYCHIPQAICQHWQQNEQGRWKGVDGVDCQFKGIVMAAFISMLHVQEKWLMGVLMEEMVIKDQCEWGDDKMVYKWLGKRVEWGGIEATKLCKVFHILTRMVEEEKGL